MISNSRTIDDEMILSMPFGKNQNNNNEEFKIKNSNHSNLQKYEEIIKKNTLTCNENLNESKEMNISKIKKWQQKKDSLNI